MIRLTILILSVFQASLAFSATTTSVERRYSREYNECMATGDAKDGVTSAIMECNGQEIGRQDARLNQAYRMVMVRLNAAQKLALRTSERQWILDRDARCHKAIGDESGGSLGEIIFSDCILNETIKRTEWLEIYKG